MEDEAQLAIWSAFQAAGGGAGHDSNTAIPGANFSSALSADQREAEDKLDADRPTKWPRADGKGSARSDLDKPDGNRRGSSNAGSRQKRGGGNGGQGSSWGSGFGWNEQGWGRQGREEDDVTAMLRAKVELLVKLVLRHEDSINIWRAECSFVLFVKTGVPGSLVPALFAAKDEWQRIKTAKPETVKSPMRCVLLSCLVRELHNRLQILQKDTARRESMAKLGWIRDDMFQRLRWNATSKKVEIDAEGTPIAYDAVLELLTSVMTRTNTIEAVMRFHPTRPMAESMPVGTLAFMLQFGLQHESGAQLYHDFAKLCHCGATMVAGIEMRKERIGRSALANLLSKA